MGRTVVCGRFEWDEDKARANLKKHKISFEEVLPMFDDPLFAERYDAKNSTIDESRFRGVGKIRGFTVIVTCYTFRSERTRIINARIATSKEEKDYERWCRYFHG